MRRLLWSISALTLATAASGADAVSPPSPFIPPSASPASHPKQDAEYELVGMTVIGKNTFLSIARIANHDSLWIPVGGSSKGISVLSYDARRDEAVIRAGDKEHMLKMRQARVTTAPVLATVISTPPPTTVSADSAPTVTVPETPLTEREMKEMEARSLVMDLLEIGVRQRQAYAEALRKAAKERADATKSSAR